MDFQKQWGAQVNYTGCIQDSYANGNGTAFVLDNDNFNHIWIFNGFWQGGELNGYAESKNFETRAWYEGSWKAGLYHGQGVLRNPNGDMFTGQFEMGTLKIADRIEFVNGTTILN